MKKRTLTLIALLSLLLAGCKDKTGSETSAPQPSESVSEKEHEEVSKTTKPSEGSDKESGKGEDKDTMATGSVSAEPTVSSVDLAAQWPKDIKEAFKQYLGGQRIPYINLGKGSELEFAFQEASYDDYYHYEVGGTEEYTSALANTFKSVYTQDGYTVTSVTDGRKAVKDSIHLTVKLANEDDYALLKIYYDEPYDKSKFTGYSADITTELQNVFGTHGQDVPAVYLGTLNPYVPTSYSTSTNSLTLAGFKWNDQVISDALATLGASGAGFDTTGSTADEVVATKDFSSDKTTRKITVSKNSGFTYYNKPAYPERKIQLIEGYDPSSFTAWPQDILDLLPTYFDGHTLPVFYRGTKNPTSTYPSASLGKIEITGGPWDDRIRTNALSVLTAAGYSEDTEAESSSYQDNVLIRKKTETDGCELKINLFKAYGDICRAYIYCTEGFGDPSTFSEWPQDIKDAFDQYCLAGVYPPAVYLGKTISLRTVTKTGQVEIRANTWHDEARSNALTFLTGKGWTEDTAAEEDSYKTNVLIRNSPVDATNHFKWERTLYKYSNQVDCVFKRVKIYNPDSTATAYPQDVLNDISNNLNGIDLPYVYLGGDNPTSTYYSYSKYLEIEGEAWDDEIITKAKTAYQAKGWDVVDGATATSVSFAKHDSAKGFYYATISKDSYNNTPTIDVYYLPWTNQTSYPTAIDTQVKTLRENKTTLPYRYLGEDSALQIEESDGQTIIYGDLRNNKITSYLFKKAYKDAGWTRSTDGSTATKTVDGYTFKVTFGSVYDEYYDIYAGIGIMVIPPYNFSDQASRSYSTSEVSTIHTALGNNDIPRVYLGTKNYTLTTGTYNASYKSGIKIVGTKWNDSVITDNKAIREKAGFTVYETKEGDSYSHFVGYGSAASLQGYKALGSSPADGYLRFIITRDENDKDDAVAEAVFFYDAPVTINDASSATNKWNEDATNVKTRNSLIHTTLPYFDLGGTVKLAESSYTTEKGTLSIQVSYGSSSVSHQPYLRNAYNALKAWDPTLTRTNVDFSYNNVGRKGVWSGHTPDGDILTYTVSSVGSSLSINVKYSEFFNKDAATDWEQDVKDARTKQLGGHLIPYFSLGTKSPTRSASTNQIVLTGKTWDNQVFSLCESALKSDTSLSWNVVDNGEDLLLAKAEATDGTIVITIEKSSANAPVCTITYKAKASTTK